MAEVLNKEEKQEVKKEVDKALHKRELEIAKHPAKIIHSEFKQQTSAGNYRRIWFCHCISMEESYNSINIPACTVRTSGKIPIY